ncbi:hypothetical protein [Deinococcus sp. UYEF24]
MQEDIAAVADRAERFVYSEWKMHLAPLIRRPELALALIDWYTERKNAVRRQAAR